MGKKKSGRQSNVHNRFRLSDEEIKALGLQKKESGNRRYYLNQHKRAQLKEMRGGQTSINVETVDQTAKGVHEKGSVKIEDSGDSRNYIYEGTMSIQDLETATEFFNIDTNIWEVEKWVANSWDVTMLTGTKTNYQIKVFLKRKSQEVKNFAEMLKEELDGYEFPKFKLLKKDRKGSNPDNCGIINLFDAHIDKMCYIGKGSLERNIETFEGSFDILLDSAIKKGCSTIIIPVGNDFWNTNAGMNTTKKGTPQSNVAIADVDSFAIGTRLIRRCIDKAATYCKVIVVMIPGNHDEDKVMYAGELLNQIYEGTPEVFINKAKKNRKYIEWGKCLFGFAHGDKERNKIAQMPLIMAEEMKEAWGRTKYREFYMGDIHHKQEYKFLRGKDFVGCMVRFLRSVGTSTDKWHLEEGYIGVPKTAELFVWNKERGMITNNLENI